MTETPGSTDDAPHGGGAAPDDAVVIERTFDAPIDIVWQVWTEAEHFGAWYGPPGASIPVAEMDVRVGGLRRICMEMQTPDGVMTMWFVGEYVEVSRPERLVYTEATADEDGNATSPITTVTVQLRAIGAGTAMVMTHAGIPSDSPGAQGWAMAFDKLDALIGQVPPSG